MQLPRCILKPTWSNRGERSTGWSYLSCNLVRLGAKSPYTTSTCDSHQCAAGRFAQLLDFIERLDVRRVNWRKKYDYPYAWRGSVEPFGVGARRSELPSSKRGGAQKERGWYPTISFDTARQEDRCSRRRGQRHAGGTDMDIDDDLRSDEVSIAEFVAAARATRSDAWKSVERLKVACELECSAAGIRTSASSWTSQLSRFLEAPIRSASERSPFYVSVAGQKLPTG